MTKKHILLHGFGSFPLIFKALIEHAQAANDPIEWSIVCTTGHYVDMFKGLLGEESVLYLHSDIRKHLSTPDLLDQLSAYEGNIYRNIESEKRYTKHKKSMRQLRNAAAMYLSIKNFTEKRSPTHILFGHIEGLDGMTLVSVAQELGIPALIPSHTRHLGETFLSPDHLETLPASHIITEAHRQKAHDFLQRFRAGVTRASSIPESLLRAPDEYYSCEQPSLPLRMINAVRRLVNEPEMREPDVFRASVLITFPSIANFLWKARGALNERIYDIDSLNQLPNRFAYYPLQYSPESSINTPAPYFVDQMRAIDAIRFALPPNMLLVIKEHPGCMGLRPVKFMKEMKRKAGVIIARYDMPSDAIVDKAAITLSVTGTAVLEAFLYGKPSLALGNAFFAEFMGGATGVDSLPQRIRTALDHPPSDNKILDALARVYAVGAPFVIGSPFDRDSVFAKYCLNKTNIGNFYQHLRRELG